ncbi:MAG TPA: hypothetical protein VI230_09030 [Ignavibacteriaceae bacterium]
MEIVRIFELEHQGLYAIKYENEDSDEFSRLFDLWQDIQYLEDFFETNKDDLVKSFYSYISIEKAVLQTRDDAKELQKIILGVKNDGNKKLFLDDYFKPLDNITYKPDELQKSKAYGILEKSWIRLYAIKLDENYYLITGGSIKLTKKMSVRIHTQKELEKLNRCHAFLKENGIIDVDGIKEISK